jgi:DNA-binding transcriptional LysR family regulator
MELKQLRYFVTVAEELHFGRAAERLKVAQPMLSRSIQELERELGYPLLARESGALTLTGGGRAFVEGARRLLGEAPRPLRASPISAVPGDALRIGQLASITSRVIPVILTAFREKHPEHPLELSTGTSPEHIESLRANACDVAFVRMPEAAHPELLQVTIEEEPLRVALAPSNPLAAHATIHPRDLVQQPLVFFPRDLNAVLHDDILTRLEQAAGARAHVVTEAPTLESVLSSIAICEAVALVTMSQANDAPRYGLSVRPLAPPGLGVQLFLAWRRGPLSPAAQSFVDLAKSFSTFEPLRAMLT